MLVWLLGTTEGMNNSVATLTVDIDEHVFGRALPQVAQTGYTVQGSSVIRSGSMDGEALLDIK